MSECARCDERLSIEDTCLRAHPGEWTHKKCCAAEHEEQEAQR